MTFEPKAATAETIAANQAVLEQLPFDDRRSYDDARRGFIASIAPKIVTGPDGSTVWDLERFGFLAGSSPDTVNPSLWRMAQLNMNHGLFKVVDRIYQIRGLDISNMTVVEGDTGYVVIDPLLTAESAAAGMQLVREHLGDRPIRAIIYTHSHSDHFGGVKGIVSEDDVRSGAIRIVAPTGFMAHAISENVYAGTPMTRRAHYMYGVTLPPGARGLVSTGLGIALARGTTTLLEPTDLVTESGQELTLDGVRIVFQFTPDSEAPAEMNFHFPQFRALCMAENVSHNMHNLYTLRGAQIRDAAAWSDYIHEALEQFSAESDVLFISHHWPVWGRANIQEFLEKQRDLYRFLHDETLRLAAHGHTMVEIAEMIELPDSLDSFWANRGYYGTLDHNVKAVYQKYLGWFDGNPANLHPHEPVAAGARYVDFMGGPDAVLEKARRSFDDGDYRWVVQVVNHVVFADPGNRDALNLQADALEQLGYQAESAPWRNFYLTGAQELRDGVAVRGRGAASPDVLAAMTTDMLLNYLAIRLNGPKAAEHDLGIRIRVSDTEEQRLVRVRRGVLIRSAHPQKADAPADVSVELDRGTLAMLVLGRLSVDDAIAAGASVLSGDSEAFYELFALCDHFEPSFDIVTP